MKKIFYIIIFTTILFIQNSFALSRANVIIMESTENIQYLVQRVTRNYLLLYKRPNDFILKNKFKENIKQLEKNINNIDKTTKNLATKDILDFYAFRLEFMNELLNQKITIKNIRELLENSESMLEGAKTITEQHQYKLSEEESMLVRYKELIYLIESVSKYYLAFEIGLRDDIYNQAMKDILKKIDNDLKKIETYDYNPELKEKFLKIKNIWRTQKYFIPIREESTFPSLILESNDYINELLSDLEEYHKQNL